MNARTMALALVLGLVSAMGAHASASTKLTLDCTGYGTSHTARMKFDIELPGCIVYWHELDRVLETLECAPPKIVAKKPFAPTRHDVVMFDLETMRFISRFSSVEDRGHCRREG